jgi:hypothetical protein
MLGRIDQFFFNRRRIALPELTSVLRILVEKHLDDPSLKITEFNLPRLVYGPKCALHPDKNKLQKQACFKLKSLLFSGEIELKNNNYELSAKALATLEKYECESRRHTQIIYLTAALVVVGFIQVGVAWFTSTPRDINDDSTQAVTIQPPSQYFDSQNEKLGSYSQDARDVAGGSERLPQATVIEPINSKKP